MDLGFGSLLDKIEEHCGKLAVKVAVFSALGCIVGGFLQIALSLAQTLYTLHARTPAQIILNFTVHTALLIAVVFVANAAVAGMIEYRIWRARRHADVTVARVDEMIQTDLSLHKETEALLAKAEGRMDEAKRLTDKVALATDEVHRRMIQMGIEQDT